MKTETSATDVIWTSSVELSQLTHEECFPVIGGCHVSSILSNVDASGPDKVLQSNSEIPHTMDLIVLQNNDYKVAIQSDLNNQISNDFILLKENGDNANENSEPADQKDINGKLSAKKIKKTKDDDFENMLYFVCNLCPYLCIKDSKITEHLEMEHKSKTNTKSLQLKCPACPNIFYHKISLRSHLIHDHKVGNSDLRRIIQAVLYFSKKSLNNAVKSAEPNKNEVPTAAINCKNEMDLKYIEKLINTEKILSHDDSMSNEIQEVSNVQLENSNENGFEEVNSIQDLRYKDLDKTREVQLLPEVVSLPMIDITHNDAAKTYMKTLIKKRSDSLSKYLDQKKLHKCTVAMCKVRLQDPTKITYHIKCHTEGSFKCPECNEQFAFWKPLTGHLWRLHKIDMELYACDKCDYKTFSLGKLNNIHKLIHSDLRAFTCDVCHKAFKNTKQLRNHKMTHKEKTDKLTHICEVCAKAFADRRQLRVHMDGVHKKIKPFLCSYCGYKGASKSALKMHIRQHTGEKPFACDSCDYTTADHNSLRRHKLRHTGHKPYKCAHCDYACIQSSTYKVHLRTKHPGLEKDLLFTCQDCQFRTVNQEMFFSHLFLVHRQKATFQL